MDTTPLYLAAGATATIGAATTGHPQGAAIIGALTAVALGTYLAALIIRRATP